MFQQKFFVFLLYFLLNWTFFSEGCHSSLHFRRKRQLPSPADAVEETRNLRNFFSACMLDRAGPTFNWDSVVDFSILDTLWYERTDDEVCSNDTVSCWQERLLNYLKPSSNVLPIARDCIEQLDIAVEETGRIEYRSQRAKRSSPRYSYSDPTKSPENFLMRQYAQCVQGRLVLPRNRRHLSVKSVVEFVEENTICGECSRIRIPNEVYTEGRSLSSSSSSSSSFSNPFFGSSTTGHFSSFFTSSSHHGRPAAETFPFIFQALTLRSSPLLPTIAGCNQDFLRLFVPAGDDIPNVGWTLWTSWGVCRAPCGGRITQIRQRTCPLGLPGVDPCVGESSERRTCQKQNCPKWSSWSNWSACSVTCGRQRQTSKRRCINGAVGQLGCIGRRQRSKLCKQKDCLGTWTKWTPWSACSSTCGTGSRVRRRRCPGPYRCLPDNNGNEIFQAELCNTMVCRKTWGSWGPWSKCPITCGGSSTFVERRRICKGERNLADCEGPYIKRKKCGRKSCPGPHWGEWSSWSDCAWRKRNRRCMGGPPESCPGSDVAYERGSNCGSYRQDHWSSWSKWSNCFGSCYFARQRRHRNCLQERRIHGCSGRAVESQQCRPPSC